MKSKSFNQKLLSEHTENEVNFNAEGFPKKQNPASEEVFMTPNENDLKKDEFSSQIDPFDKVSPEINNIENSNLGISDINLSTSNSKTEEWKKAVRKEYERNKPSE
ncbi:MAG: hypothetical protein KG029_20235 [Bacteroidetes bacterium]|nr:hypothetical protein [Bacteroidota bacterium]